MELKTKYLPLSTKAAIIDAIAENSILLENDIASIDYTYIELKTDLLILQNYFDIDIEKEDIDELYSSGKLEEMKSLIPLSEIQYIQKHVDLSVKQKVEIHNKFNLDIKLGLILEKLEEVKADSLENQLGNFLQKVIDTIPNDKKIKSLFKSITKEVNNFDPDKLKMIKGLVNDLGGKEVPDTDKIIQMVKSAEQTLQNK